MADEAPGRGHRELLERIGDLESTQRELERSLEEIDHQRRRVADRIERAGGRDREAEAEYARLRDSLDANRRDHEANGRELDRLRTALRRLGEPDAR